MTLKRLPAFASEEEEATWWYENREQHEAELIVAMQEGRVRHGGIARRIEEAKKASTMTLTAEDALKAVRIAEEKGLEVRAYLADLIHAALKADLMSLLHEQEDDAQSSSVVVSESSLENRLLQH